MKFILLIALIAVASAASRQKRQLAVGTISVSGAGGATGCVVTGNVLYANGIKLRELTSSEQSELQTYQTEVEQYKTQLREILNQRRENMRGRLMAGARNQNQQQQQQFLQQSQNDVTSNNGNTNGATNNGDDLPKAPEKPSFCTAEETTQYYFDGCMVQNNKVYVGSQYARDLTSDEQSQLQTFDTQQTAYQNAVQAQMQSQVRGLFGGSDFLSALFGGDDGSQGRGRQRASTTTTTEPTVTTTLPPKPTVPNFCTAIF